MGGYSEGAMRSTADRLLAINALRELPVGSLNTVLRALPSPVRVSLRDRMNIALLGSSGNGAEVLPSTQG